MTKTFKSLWKNEYLKTAVLIFALLLIVLGFFIAEIAGLIRVVTTPSMAIGYTGPGHEWTHPFDRTIQVGDIIVIQSVNPEDLNANYPNSDIIVYHIYSSDVPIVHRIVAKEQINGTWYFYTKGDANGWNKWPATPSPAEYDAWAPSPIPPGMIIGKVVMRIPWVGNIAIFMQGILGVRNNHLVIPIILALIVILIIVEFIIPICKHKKHLTKKTPQQG